MSAIDTIISKPYCYAGVCTCCNRYNIGFKNFLLDLDYQELLKFKDIIANKKKVVEFPTSHGNDVLLATPMPHFSILLSKVELIQLNDLIHELYTIITSRRLIEGLPC